MGGITPEFKVDDIKTFVTERAPAFVRMIDQQIKGPFLFGDKMTYADIVLADNIDVCECIYAEVFKAGPPNPFEGSAKLQTLLKSLRSKPEWNRSGLAPILDAYVIKA